MCILTSPNDLSNKLSPVIWPSHGRWPDLGHCLGASLQSFVRDSSPYNFVCDFGKKGTPFVYPLLKKGSPFCFVYQKLHPFSKPLIKKLMNNAMGEHEALPEEILTKNRFHLSSSRLSYI